MPLWSRLFLVISVLCFFVAGGNAQRAYKPHSVFAEGTWFKIALSTEGICKMEAAFLSSLGLGTAIPSGQLRVYAKNNGMLPEAANGPYSDDLEEIALFIVDGGDGVLNGGDYALFYSTGPSRWLPDSASRLFSFQKNLYSTKAFYYLTIGGTGKRIPASTFTTPAVVSTTSFTERFVHELDSVNFLASGKEWYGEEFSHLPGRSLTKAFSLTSPSAIPNTPFSIVSFVAGRSVNSAGRFDVSVNSELIQQIGIPPVNGGVHDVFAHSAQQSNTGTLATNAISVQFRYFPGSANAQGWLNRFLLFYRRQLSLPANQALLFRDWNTVGSTAVQYRITGAEAVTQVWDITRPNNPVKMNTALTGNELVFTNEAQTLHEYACFSTSFLKPEAVGRVPNQDLHHTTEKDYFIITHPLFLTQARRLAQYHEQRNGLKTAVVTTDQVFNEFSGGIPDPAAFRDFLKMYYDTYQATWGSRGRYLLLFGRGSFDYKDRIHNNTNLVQAYESVSSLDPLSTYTSDDFFGFLDTHEDINSGVIINELDIGIGRIPVKNEEEAKAYVDKVIGYHSPPSLGPWRTHINVVADDEDFNLHQQDAEVVSSTVQTAAPLFTIYKIYLDAFRQEGGAAGGRYPQANEAINNNIYNGTLIWNYSGHGGPYRLAEEVIMDGQSINLWNNVNKLPLYITATCDFAPFDNPTIPSLGENLLLRPKTGAIALMTTTRVVFAYSNRIINNNYLQAALQPDSNGRYKTLGEAVQAAKNFTYRTSGDVTNNRKFALLGDPALTLGFPSFKVNITAVNNRNIASHPDTLRATELVTVQGEVRDYADRFLPSFTGTVYLSLFDKPQTVTTLANDPTSQPVNFTLQTASLFKGKVSAAGGRFEAKFRLPKDMNYQVGKGKLSLYAQDGVREGAGYYNEVLIGGISTAATADKEGPWIKAFLNDERFVNGSITNEAPVLILKLTDSSGINTGNAGIGHDLIATLDNDNRQYYLLNDFYESDLDSYQQGTVRFQLPPLKPGPHSLKIKAWDVVNNSSEYELEFMVANNEELMLRHVLNYPNPFTTKTAFWFEHNKPGMDLQVRIEVFSVTGRIIKTIARTINTAGNRSNEIEWDGKDEFGDRPGRGVYLYRLSVKSADGKNATQMQRLVLIQ